MPQVVLYFAGWNLNRDGRQHTGEVSSLPWERVSGINHAFWAVEPADGASESSFERKKRGAPARTAWRLVPLHPECDEGDTQPSAVCPELPRSHFAQYAALHARWPEVQILLSIGGWTRCGYFSEMAHTPEGRAGFIKECLALLRRRSWLAGLDIDWEYPACARRRMKATRTETRAAACLEHPRKIAPISRRSCASCARRWTVRSEKMQKS